MKKKILLITLTVLFVFACKESPDRTENNKALSSIKFQNLQSTVRTNEDVKVVAELVKPQFKDKDSEIVVIIEMGEENVLKPDLSNEKDAKLAVFQNLSTDSINQNFINTKDLKKTAVFGRRFQDPGLQKIRGYVLEYYDFEISRGYDITNDSFNADKISKTYFETEIEITGE